MQGVLVVFSVTGWKHTMVAPNEEAEQSIKKCIEGSRLENAVVREFMGTITEKRVECAVKKQNQGDGVEAEVQ